MAAFNQITTSMPVMPSSLRPTLGDYAGDYTGYFAALRDYNLGNLPAVSGPSPSAPSAPPAPAAPVPTGPAPAAPAPSATPATPTVPAATTPANSLSPANALNSFANSAGMKFAMEQGANALNNLYAARGQVQSGAAAKALQTYGQNTALQSYFFPYMNYLTGQQAMGAQAAGAISGLGSSYANTVNGMGQNYSSAVTGAGQNYANAATGINSGMAGAIGQGAINIGNAQAGQAAINGYANGQVGSAIGGAIGTIGSSFMAPRTPTYSGAQTPYY